MLKQYCIGFSILIVAIITNAIIAKTNITSWYDFFQLISNHGTEAFNKINLLDYLWLFIGYPFVLSLGYLLGNKVYSILFNN